MKTWRALFFISIVGSVLFFWGSDLLVAQDRYELKAPGFSKEAAKSGEAIFKEHCAICHPDGGNIIKPEMTLHKKHLAAHGIKTADDIIRIMRNPGPGMPKFSENILSNEDAKKIAEYILKTFNSHIINPAENINKIVSEKEK